MERLFPEAYARLNSVVSIFFNTYCSSKWAEIASAKFAKDQPSQSIEESRIVPAGICLKTQKICQQFLIPRLRLLVLCKSIWRSQIRLWKQNQYWLKICVKKKQSNWEGTNLKRRPSNVCIKSRNSPSCSWYISHRYISKIFRFFYLSYCIFVRKKI